MMPDASQKLQKKECSLQMGLQLEIEQKVADPFKIRLQKVDQDVYKRTIKCCAKVSKVGFHNWKVGSSQSSLSNSLSKV